MDIKNTRQLLKAIACKILIHYSNINVEQMLTIFRRLSPYIRQRGFSPCTVATQQQRVRRARMGSELVTISMVVLVQMRM